MYIHASYATLLNRKLSFIYRETRDHTVTQIFGYNTRVVRIIQFVFERGFINYILQQHVGINLKTKPNTDHGLSIDIVFLLEI